jgi:hypothetical protein
MRRAPLRKALWLKLFARPWFASSSSFLDLDQCEELSWPLQVAPQAFVHHAHTTYDWDGARLEQLRGSAFVFTQCLNLGGTHNSRTTG